MHTHPQRYQESRKATLYGALKNSVLGCIKTILGITGHSHALIADGIHSFADLFTDVLVLMTAHWGSQEADDNHPYGHQRIETAGSMLLAFLLIVTGGIIAYEAILHCFVAPEKPHFYALLVALLSTILNELVYQYTRHTAKKIQSNLLHANALHHRSDAASSLIVLIGIAGAYFGWYWLDPLAAGIVGLLIIKMGGELAWSSISELVDTGVNPALLEKIDQIIQHTSGVKTIHQLRTRSMGGEVFVDVHILVEPWYSVSEGHHIAERVHQRLKKNVAEVTDVTVHVDSEDDTTFYKSQPLPTREMLLKTLHEKTGISWESTFSVITIHYLNGQVFLDVYLEETHKIDLTDTIKKLRDELPIVGDVRVYHLQ